MLRLTSLFILTSLFCLTVSSQEKVNYANLKSLRKNGEFIRFQVEEFNPKKNNKYDNSLTYYWYKSQNVMSTQGGSSGLLLNGIYEQFYANKQLAIKGFFKKGLKHGTWTYWNEEGRLKKEEFWRHGKPKKSAVIYNKNGGIKKEKNYGKDEVVHNLEDKVITTNIDSTEVEVIEKYPNGKTKSVSRSKDGELHGKQLKYNQNGELISQENYKNGELHGKQMLEDGAVKHYKNGEEKTPFLKQLFKKKEATEGEEEAEETETKEQDDSEKDTKKSRKRKKKKEKKEESNKGEDFITY